MLALTIKLKRTEFITGESLPIEVRLENQSQSPLEVPDPTIGSEFRYTITSQANAVEVHHLSAARAYAERNMEPQAALDLPGLQLAPGVQQVYHEDLADYQVTPIGPGQYKLMVGYHGRHGLVESTSVAIAIAPPRPTRMVTLAGATEERVAVVFAQPSGYEQIGVYQIENRRCRPGDGAAYPRKGELSDLRGIAVAVDLADNEGRRWFAWEEEGMVGAGKGYGRYVSRLMPAIAHGLHDPELSPVGWQPSNNAALFVVLGSGASGQSAVAVTTFSLSATGSVITIPVACPKAPKAWATQYQVSSDDVHIELITAAQAAHATLIMRQTLLLGSNKAIAPTMLLERPGVVLALTMAPVGQINEAVVDILFGPDPKTGYLSLFRLPLAGGATSAAWHFSPPRGEKPATAWAIPRTPLNPPMVAMHAGEKIYLRRAGGEWTVVSDGVPHLDHLAIEAFSEGRVVAVWSDPTFGIRYQCVDGARPPQVPLVLSGDSS
jgi:hypothetical protein